MHEHGHSYCARSFASGPSNLRQGFLVFSKPSLQRGGHMLRDLKAAQASLVTPRAELLKVQEEDGWFSVWDRANDRCYRMQWVPGDRRTLTKHGLYGFASIRDATGSKLCFERGRVHLCINTPCGARWDPRAEPTCFHAVAFHDPPADAAPSGVDAERVAAEACAEAPVESAPAPAEVTVASARREVGLAEAYAGLWHEELAWICAPLPPCLLYTSDAADE